MCRVNFSALASVIMSTGILILFQLDGSSMGAKPPSRIEPARRPQLLAGSEEGGERLQSALMRYIITDRQINAQNEQNGAHNLRRVFEWGEEVEQRSKREDEWLYREALKLAGTW